MSSELIEDAGFLWPAIASAIEFAATPRWLFSRALLPHRAKYQIGERIRTFCGLWLPAPKVWTDADQPLCKVCSR